MKTCKTFKILDARNTQQFRENPYLWKYLIEHLGYQEIQEGTPDLILHSVFGKEHQKAEYRDCKKLLISAENLHYHRYFTVANLLNGLAYFKIPKKWIHKIQNFLKEKILTFRFWRMKHFQSCFEQLEKKNHFWLLSNEKVSLSLDFPYFLYAHNQDFFSLFPQDKKRKKLTEKQFHQKKFCAFVVSNWENQERIQFFKKLSQYKMVDSYGAVYYNCDFPQNERNNFLNNQELFEQYKFVICFENSQAESYITEKILNVFLAGALPIYRGAPNIKDYFEASSFLNADDFPNFESLIAKIKELDQDYEKYLQFFEKSPLKTPKIQSKIEELHQFYQKNFA